jgi:hypothetical protein
MLPEKRTTPTVRWAAMSWKQRWAYRELEAVRREIAGRTGSLRRQGGARHFENQLTGIGTRESGAFRRPTASPRPAIFAPGQL